MARESESRRVGGSEGRRVGESESRRVGESESKSIPTLRRISTLSARRICHPRYSAPYPPIASSTTAMLPGCPYLISAGGRSSFEKVSACPCRKFKNGFTPARDRARSPATGVDCSWSSTGSAAFWLASTASNSTAFLCRLGATPFRAHGRHPPFGHFGLHKVGQEKNRVSEQFSRGRSANHQHVPGLLRGRAEERGGRQISVLMRGFAHDGLADAERANCCKHF